MKLFTIQPIEVVKILEETGRFVCEYSKYMDGAKEDNWDEGIDAYAWMIGQMEKRIGPAPKEGLYPVWAWAKNDNEFVNDSCAEHGKTYARIELEIDPARVLLSDFDGWHSCLNACPYVDDEESFDEKWDAIVAGGKEAIVESWEGIFDVSRSDWIQAVFWELRKEDVVSIETFVGVDRNCDDEDDDYEDELGA